ncbi:hypothetical protein [Nocardiopsis nanhaiensis]
MDITGNPKPESEPVRIFDAATGYSAVTNLLAAGDPDIHWIDNRWWMFFGAAHTDEKVNLFSATLPPGAPVTSTDWTITTDSADPARALPLIEHTESGRWNEWMHTPSYVRGTDPHTGATVERVYYTASRARTPYDGGMDRDLAIGVLERTATGWIAQDEPLITGTPARPDVLEPKAGFWEGRWRIWYVTTPNEIDKGVQPDSRIEYVDSDDGLTDWSTPTVVLDDDLHHHDAVVTRTGDRYAMVVASAPNMYDDHGYPPQGLWALTAGRPSGRRGDWSAEPKQILSGDSAPEWYAGAIYAPAAVEGDDGMLHVFFTAARKPDPEPYVLSIGRLDLPGGELPA